MTITESVPQKTAEEWKHHLQDEADAAFLYSVLANEAETSKQSVYQRLADIERRHVGMWRRLLAEHGVEVVAPEPSRRARMMAWLARRFGPSLLTSILLREEGQEVKNYLSLYRTSSLAAAKDTALVLAKESAQHADTLRGMAGADSEPWHSTKTGGFLRNVIYGFNDGLTANFGLVAGVVGAAVEPAIILVTGIAGTIADALSMGASGYLAAKSEREVYAHEIAMERDEIRMMPELEQEELALLYEAKGIEADRARAMASDVMKDPERALNEKVREELGITEAHATPFREGWVTGLATAIGALIPVFPFLFLTGTAAIATSFTISMASHFGVGAARSFFTGRSSFRSGLDMFVVGLGVAVVAYFVGEFVAGLL